VQQGATVDISADPLYPAAGGITQINGLAYEAGVLYVGGNNWNNPPHKGWIFELDPVTLAITAVHEIFSDVAGVVEGCAVRGGEFWVVFHDRADVAHYNAAWVHQATYALPFRYNDSAQLYQGGFWIGDLLFINKHRDASEDVLDVCKWTGTEFVYVTRIGVPTDDCGQGVAYYDGTVWWAERTGTTTSPVVETLLEGG
jgi:hypothetical protein